MGRERGHTRLTLAWSTTKMRILDTLRRGVRRKGRLRQTLLLLPVAVAIATLPSGCVRAGFSLSMVGTEAESGPVGNFVPNDTTTSHSVNEPPQAAADFVATLVDTTLQSIAVLGNDIDPDDDQLTLVDVGSPANGTARINSDSSTVRYTPAAGFAGRDRFTYTVSDGQGHEVGASVEVAVGQRFVWVGLAPDHAWYSPQNWIGNVIPTKDDVAIFDDSCSGHNCDCSVTRDVTVGGIRIADSYGGTFRQIRNASLIIGSHGLSQQGGAFLGGDGPIDIDGNFSLLGGSFVSTRGELSIGGTYLDHNTGGLTVAQGAQFEANGGTLVFDADKGNALYTTVTLVEAAGGIQLNHLSLDVADPNATHGSNGAVVRLTEDSVLRIGGDLRMRDGKIVGGRIELAGDLVVSCEGGGICAEGTLTPVVLNRPGLQRYSGNAGTGPFLVVDKPSGSVEPDSSVTNYALSGLLLRRGRFVSPPGVFRFHFDHEYGLPGYSKEIGLRVLGGDFETNASSYNIDIQVSRDTNWSMFLLESAETLVLPQLTIRLDDYNFRSGFNGESIDLAAGTTVRVTGALSVWDGRLNGGQLEAGGDVTLFCSGERSCVGGGTTQLVINGNGDQQLSQVGATQAAIVPGLVLSIDKSGGQLNLANNLMLDQDGQSLALLDGTVVAGGRSITVDGNLSLAPGARLEMAGGTLDAGSIDNQGVIQP